MRKFILGGFAAMALVLGFTATNASADWVTRTRYRWDPVCGRYIAVAERVWIPEVEYYDTYRPRPWYYFGYSWHPGHAHHEHHEHHHHR